MKRLTKLLVICFVFIASTLIINDKVKATSRTSAEAIQWVQSQVGKSIDHDGAYGAQCVDLIRAYYEYLGVSPVRGNGCDYVNNSLPSGWSRIQGAVPQMGDILVYTGGYGHVAIYESTYSTYHQNYNYHSYVERITSIAYNRFSTTPYWGVIRPNFTSLKYENLTTPTITTNKQWYSKGEVVHLSWVASSNNTDFKHYWLVITNTTTNKKYRSSSVGKDGDPSVNYFDISLPEEGKYSITVYAVPNDEKITAGKVATKEIYVGTPPSLTTPTITTNKDWYKKGETVRISWVASSNYTDFKHYWLVITNTTTNKKYRSSSVGKDGDPSVNYFDISLPEEGKYSITVYAVPNDERITAGKVATTSIEVGTPLELTVPEITLSKSRFKTNENIRITWKASSERTDFKHYWLVITNTTTNKKYRSSSVGKDGDPSVNYFDISLPEEGKYSITVYAVPNDETTTAGKVATATITVTSKDDLARPVITTNKKVYQPGDTVHISWKTSPYETDFCKYWLTIKEELTNTLIYDGSMGSEKNNTQNVYDIVLPATGKYLITVQAIPNNTELYEIATSTLHISVSSEATNQYSPPVSSGSVELAVSPDRAKKPSKVTGLSIKKKKGNVVLKWKKTRGVKRYQIQYSTNKKFKKKSSQYIKNTSVTIKKLKKEKIYYFRVRAYKISNSRNVYGKWSKVKIIKVK